MLAFRRSLTMPEIGAGYTVVDYAHPSFRVRAERAVGIQADEALIFPMVAWSGYGDRPRLDVVLRGEVRDVENGVVRWLRPGEFTIGRALDSLFMRSQAEELLLLSIEWNLGSLGTDAPIGLPVGRLAENDRADVTAAVEALLSQEIAESQSFAVGAIGRVLACLRAAGVPFDSWRAKDLLAPVPIQLQRVATAVGRNLSRIGARPGTAELEQELGLSRRRVAQLIGELTARYGMNGTDWRTLRDRWRLGSSILLMSNPRARTENVARAVGYGSPNALCHAYREANLPSPGSVRQAIARLI
jgi:AraC-like DNA-binding protein